MQTYTFDGRLVADPTIRMANTAKGQTKCCSMRISTETYGKDQNGYRNTVILSVTAWGHNADYLERVNPIKGTTVLVRGIVKGAHPWTGKNGDQHADVEVDADDIRVLKLPDPGERPAMPAPASAARPQEPEQMPIVVDEDLPF